MKKIIFYELNEISPRLLEYYIKSKPQSALAKLVKKRNYFKTHTTDTGELHPWSTWPTIHRGVNNTKHNIRFINQDLLASAKYPPIWELLEKDNISIGLFGSLQSFPPIKSKNIKFYMPDTFAPSHDCFPKSIEIFQKFNLLMTNRNKGIARSYTKESLSIFFNVFKNLQISSSVIFKIIKQVSLELIFTRYKSRRSLLQPILGFDLFLKLMKNNLPSFATFFTNHVAGMQHRYWGHLFPGETVIDISEVNNFYANSIIKALDIADIQIRELLDFSKKNNYTLFILSSMGQDSIMRDVYIPELYLEDLNLFIKESGLESSDYKLMPAMQPDICIKCNSKASLKKLLDITENIKDSNGNKLLKKVYEPIGLTLNLSLLRSKLLAKKQVLIFKGKTINIKKFGFTIINRHPGTGYHIPEGILIIDDDQINAKLKDKFQKFIDTRKIAPLILEYFNLDIPNYM